ncbi:YggN family protein [Ferrimonas balearica]|uniref:YggN family protein n=1 Tax=Ferrimonas balearica TaxID=44012 RepID=UPI001C98FA4A|nr:YggN family protein [Ferrimonas balearica]MBY5992613.1 YggN family protein [Ferrimonas balearica]
MFSRLLLLFTLMLPAGAMAVEVGDHFSNQCDLSLNFDLSLTPEQLVVSDGDEELYRIRGDRLWVRGQEVELDSEQRQLVRDYHAEMERQVPEVLALVDDSLLLAGEALDAVFTELAEIGVDPGQGSRIMDTIRDKVAQRMHADDGTYHLGAQSVDKLGEDLDSELESQIEEVVAQSVGSLLMALGDAMANGTGEDFEQKMEAFGNRMERMGEQLETQLEAKASLIEERAESLCQEWMALDQLEQQMQRSIPQMAEFDLVVQGDPDLAWLR